MCVRTSVGMGEGGKYCPLIFIYTLCCSFQINVAIMF